MYMASTLPKAQSLALALLSAQARVVSRRPVASLPGSRFKETEVGGHGI